MKKKLLFTTVSAIVLMTTQPGLAEENLIDLSDKPITTPTLDYLHEKGLAMPESEKVYPESAYTITPGTADDYSFIAPVADSDGNLTNEYYKINFKNTDRITWTPDSDRTLTLNLPNAENPTEYKYTYTMPEGYTETNTPLHNDLTADNAQSLVFTSISSSTSGSAIYNNKDSSGFDIKADFINSTQGFSAKGGAIHNGGTNGKIGAIEGNFIGNYVISESLDAQGGAIYNESGTITSIEGNFINNFATLTKSSGSYTYGGAIYNTGKISNIIGEFIGNYATFINGRGGKGGAIYNGSTISNIIGDFIGNYASMGGAIYNGRTISNITGDFIGNYASSKGGAIYNALTINNIIGNFISNYTNSKGWAIYGGAIYNEGKIINIIGEFIGNYANGYGGAIFNSGTNVKIGAIEGNFINNSAISESSNAHGGAIYNRNGTIGNETIGIKGNFTGNKAIASSGQASGGAIYNGNNNTKIGTIDGDFINNSAQGSSSAHGGAISNDKTIGDITGDFINNSAQASYAEGGAIYNDGLNTKIGAIEGNFINNLAQGSSYAEGGAIYNGRGTIGNETMGIKGNFTGNKAIASSSYARGGAIYNSGTILDITGSFLNNYVQGKEGTQYANQRIAGGAIYNYAASGTSKIGDIVGSMIDGRRVAFMGNQVKATGTENYAQAYGGAIYNYGTNAKIGVIDGDFTDNSATSEKSSAYGGAIYNESGTIGNIINSSFHDNYVSGNEESKGGAIYSTKDITITAQENGTSEFTGNYVLANGVKSANAIYMDSDSSTLSLNALTNGQILFNDEIDGVEGYKIAIDGDSSGTVTFNNNIRNADITLSNTNLVVTDARYLGESELLDDGSGDITIGSDETTNENTSRARMMLMPRTLDADLGSNEPLLIQSGNLTINSGEITIKQLGSNTLNFKSLAMPGGLLRVDSLTVDLANQTSGMITADEVSGGAGKIKVENILLTSDGEAGSTPVLFVSSNISDEVTTEVTEALAPVYKYGVAYDNESGEFIFTRGDLVEPEPTPEDPDVPSVPVTPIRPITPAYKAFNPGVFANDVFAMSSMNTQGEIAKQVFDMDTNREYCNGRIWATPYYSDDTLSYSGFYDVDSKNYGLIAGIDTRAFGDYDGWNSVYTLFGAYNDGESKYQGVKVDSKSWLVGLKASVYNGGFYGDAIVNYAWHDSDQKTAFGTDSVDSTGYGAALKAGYKHGFDKVELDTSAMLSWQTIEGDDFTSKSGAKISTDDYSRLTLTPQVKLGYSFEKVKPYALVRYNFVLDEDGSSTVNHLSNHIALPTIESKDYIEYGLGLETTDAFPHSGYAHVLRHDGGRDGWSITAGYKYNF